MATPASARTRTAWYAGVGLLALALAAAGYRLDTHDLRVPLLYHDPRGLETDSLLILPMVKSTLDRGHHWHCDRLGAPAGQDLHDFPVVDHLHFAGIWILGLFSRDVGLIFNLYYLLGFPLAAITALAVLRGMGRGFPSAAAMGLLFAFAPYHIVRGENHYFLSAYFLVPLTLRIILQVCEGPLPFFALLPSRTNLGTETRLCVTDRNTICALLIAAATSAAGAYYAFFACVLLGAAGLYGWAFHRTWRAFAVAMVLAGVIGLCGILNHLPAAWYQSQFGRNVAPTLRFSEESEYYGLKLTQLLFPIDDHSLSLFAYNKTAYNSVDRPAQAWTERYALGIVGSLGCLALLVRQLLPVPRKSPYGMLAAMSAAAIFFACTGGFGAMFNHVISPQVRCHNRIAIYLLFLVLASVAADLDAARAWLHRRYTGRLFRGRMLPALLAPCLTWFGVWDQTPFFWGGSKQVLRNTEQSEFFEKDREFFRQVEQQLNPELESPGPMVFQLPYIAWPEAPPVGRVWSYEHARGYLHTDTLRWSFGTMKGRAQDEWVRRVSALPAEPMLERIVKAGFEGLLLDRRGFGSRADAVEQSFARALGGAARIVHADGQQMVFDLRPYRDWLKQNLGRSWEEECRRERQPLAAEWLAGFASFKEPGYEYLHRWCRERGTAVFVNPTAEPRTITCRFHVRTMSPEPTTLTVRGAPIWDEILTIDNTTPVQTRTFTIPPGRTTVHFHCIPPIDFVPSDSRKLYWFIAGLKVD
jgi:hypothetical protein